MHPGISHDIPLRDVTRVTLSSELFINTEVDRSKFLIKYRDLMIPVILCLINKGESFEGRITCGDNDWLFSLNRGMQQTDTGARSSKLRYVSLSDIINNLLYWTKRNTCLLSPKTRRTGKYNLHFVLVQLSQNFNSESDTNTIRKCLLDLIIWYSAFCVLQVNFPFFSEADCLSPPITCFGI